MNFDIQPLPPPGNLQTTAVLRRAAAAHRYLGELKGKVATIPNEGILINTLALQEAKDSSAIENIITTHDEMYKAVLFENLVHNAAAKEVNRYATALKEGFEKVRTQKVITQTTILTIQKILEQNDAGYRQLPGTALINENTGKTVYTPPQEYETVSKLMDNLLAFINDEEMSDLDPLIKMAIVHHRFETIHPFYDGNGRTGRILNILYLVQQGLLDIPILYLSRFIIRRKGDYYRLLQEVRETGDWESWILYMLEGVEETAKESIEMIGQIRELMQQYKQMIRTELHKIYSQDLLNSLFKHPYTKIEFVMQELGVSRPTAANYLRQITLKGLLNKQKIGTTNYYVNEPLFNLFKTGHKRQSADTIITVNTANKRK
jgi:Fic family protein